MVVKWPIDKETSNAKPNEKVFEKVEKIKKRVARDLDINQDDKKFLCDFNYTLQEILVIPHIRFLFI